MSRFVGNFMFHPVGHGLFYSGIIKNLSTDKQVSDKQYSFVYDCGGKNLKNAIENAELPETIDLLIISHFHKDHINGVLKLIEKHEVKTVVLPYLDRTLKILYIAALADKKYKLSHKSELVKLTNFIANPKEFFGDKTEVYFISNDIEKTYSERKNIEENSNQKEEFDFDWNYKPDKDKKIPANASLESPLWSFHFFMPKRASNFNKLENFFKKKEITCENAIDNWDIIKEKIGKLKLNNNISNIVCAHGPTDNVFVQKICNNKFIPSKQFKHCLECDFLCHYHYCHWHEGDIGFQFLTGDAEIDDQKAFLDRYQNCLEKSILFQVPHHGSKENWKDWFSEYQPSCNLWPVTHNADHKYGLPSAKFSYIAPYSVTEYETTRLGIQIHFVC